MSDKGPISKALAVGFLHDTARFFEHLALGNREEDAKWQAYQANAQTLRRIAYLLGDHATIYGAPVMLDRTSDRLLKFFHYGHLPQHLQDVSKPFYELAVMMIGMLPANPERTVALRKLLEAKDCAVRALLEGEIPAPAGMVLA